mmetsp:Transcript_17653/g.35531  ORF Transcript_17653/g.35531 Transcript_17653/m.35531 type:complete len:300 (+) Transcript_17653:1257-2156(+)
MRVIAIAAGQHHSLALSASGIVFSWGRASSGVLGVGDDSFDPGADTCNLHSPYPVDKLLKLVALEEARVCAIAAGGEHSLCLTHRGSIYTWGSNHAGQLGRPPRVDSHDYHVHATSLAPSSPGVVHVPTPDDGDEGAESVSVQFRAIAGGAAHSVALTATGEVYTWGCAEKGRLGLSETRLRTMLAHDVSRGVTCRICSSGTNMPLSMCVLVPHRVHGISDVVHIAAGCSAAHTLVATRDGRVYGWGDASDHRLGLDLALDEESKAQPDSPLVSSRSGQLCCNEPVPHSPTLRVAPPIV